MERSKVAHLVMPDLCAETVYDPNEKTTRFAVFKDGEVRYEDFINTPEGGIAPLDPRSHLVSKRVVLLPSEATEYGSDEELLSEIQAFIHKRCDISPHFELISAHYVLLTWLYDRLNELPYLRVRGDYGSGKSRFLKVVGSICYRPISASGATTTSPIFRIIDQIRGTLVFDEADFGQSDEKSDMVKILNTGFQKGTPVLRTEGKGTFEVKSYDTFGPKIIATRQNYEDQALESRFLIEDMGRAKLREDIPIRLDDSFQQEALTLRNKLLMWRFRNYTRPLQFDDDRIDGLQPRLQQIIIPLLAILPGKEIRSTLIDHAHRYNSELIADRALSWESEAILAILRIHERTKLDGCTVQDIAKEMNEQSEVGDNLAPRKVGWILRSKLRLKSERTFRGFVLSFHQNKDRIEVWRERLGITDADIKGEPEIDPNDIPF